MRVHRVADADEGGRLAADVIVGALAPLAHPVLGVATGASPRPVYEELVRRFACGDLTTNDLRLAALDEYVGLGRDHPDGYRSTLQREVAVPLRVPVDRLLVPAAWESDLDRAAAGFENALRALGGVDVQLLGIGANGHIGFNEPGSPLDGRTRVVSLDDRTRRDNAVHLTVATEVPRSAITQGIGTILEAGRLVLLAYGRSKTAAVRAALYGPIDSACPASAIRLHPDVVVIADSAALDD